MLGKTISIDFDGVIYTGPFIAPCYTELHYYNDDALKFIQRALEQGFEVVVHSCRLYDDRAPTELASAMFEAIGVSFGLATANYIIPRIKFSLSKPMAVIYIDDKAFKFVGKFPLLEDL